MRWTELRLGLMVCLLAPSLTWAQSVKVHTTTVGRYQQRLRVDRTVDAVRAVSQRVNVWVWDARGNQSQDLNIHFGARYFTDFGLAQQLRLDPLFSTQWNDVVLERLTVDWTPFEPINLKVGRQWGLDSLGMYEFDGAHVQTRIRLSPDVRAHLGISAGRDVQLETGWYASDFYDVQGLPTLDRDEPLTQNAVLLGGTAGIGWDGAGLSVSYRRRDRDEILGEERFGAAFHGQVTKSINISAQGIYNQVLNGVERASLQAAASTFDRGPRLSAGVNTQKPWFDSASIFNIFGARAHHGAWLSAIQPVEGLRTTFDLRVWGREYDADSRTLGIGAGATTDLEILGLYTDWRALLTWQTSVDQISDELSAGDQFLGDLAARISLSRKVRLKARGVLLWAETSSLRYAPGWAGIGVLGVDWLSEFGTIGLLVESQQSTFQGGNLQGYVMWELEAWP